MTTAQPQPPMVFEEIGPECFPIVVCGFNQQTGERLWSARLTKPGALHIPGPPDPNPGVVVVCWWGDHTIDVVWPDGRTVRRTWNDDDNPPPGDDPEGVPE